MYTKEYKLSETTSPLPRKIYPFSATWLNEIWTFIEAWCCKMEGIQHGQSLVPQKNAGYGSFPFIATKKHRKTQD